jgi:cobalt transporter subunit CbtB
MATHLTHNTSAATSAVAGNDLLVRGAEGGGKWPALFAALLGAVMVFGVGFSDLSMSHNAAHDTRHAMVFPCH